MKDFFTKAGDLAEALKTRLSVFKKTPPVTDLAGLCEFVAGNAAFIAQKTLYGYVKTRMGMKYPALFDDDEFIASLNIGKWQLYAACLSDLAVFCAAQIYQHGITGEETARIARYAFENAIKNRFDNPEFTGKTGPLIKEFQRRIALENWDYAGKGEGAFRTSPEALVRFAPIVDELKELDAPLVKNSIRFQWQRVRSEFIKAFEAEAFLADWREKEN